MVEAEPKKRSIARWKAALIVVGVSSVLTLVTTSVLGTVLSSLPDEIKLPLLVVAAVASILASLALVVAVFAIYKLADRTFALGLPDGSIRAIIALLLIVLFCATTVFLTAKLQSAAADQPVVDFAKQLLTILGTLMTAVSSFYFGTRAVADGARTIPPSAPTTSAPDERSGGGTLGRGGSREPTGGIVINGDVAASSGGSSDLLRDLPIEELKGELRRRQRLERLEATRAAILTPEPGQSDSPK